MELTPVFVLAVIFGGIALIVKIVSDNRLRNKIVDKGLLDEKVKYLYMRSAGPAPLTSLKWGIILTSLGIALFLVRMFPIFFRNEETMLGILFVAAGVALFVHYFIANRAASREIS